MIIKNNNSINKFRVNTTDSPKDDITTMYGNGSDGLLNSRIRRNHIVLEAIKNHSKITKYQLRKILKLPYSSISRSVEDLLYGGLISSTLIIDNEKRKQRLLFVPEFEGDKDAK